MNRNTVNGKAKSQSRGSRATLPELPDSADNPFLQPAWPKPFGPNDSAPPSLQPGMTKKQRRTVEEGQTQQIKQGFQRSKALYAVAASAQVNDVANWAFVHLGTNIVLRIRANRYEELEPYLELMKDAQLRRAGQEFIQMASDHARTQSEIAAEVIDVDGEDLRSFWAKVLQPVNRDF